MIMNMEINDQTIAKGKRTKRPRPSSSASSGGGARGATAGGEYCSYSFVSSPTTSSGISTCTEEDEDMANCLILLAHGGSPPQTSAENNRFISRRFTETATSTIGKVGTYVYDCKTCNRTFPSFQALGGHRASHKKPKITADIDRKKSPPPPEPFIPSSSSHIDQNKAKIHECSICGSEFASGQALGGHMRRHRSAAPNDTTPISHDQKRRNMLALDLNLPAPPEDGQYNQFSQPNVVFAAAALVDCHY